jgi:hypothetical protein
MFLVSPSTIRNPGALRTRSLPRRIGGRIFPWPRRAPPGLWLRLLLEVQALRYALPLLPLLAIGFLWTETALPLSQAPLLMFVLILAVEMRVLRLGPRARARLIDPAEAERGLDLLRIRSRAILTRIAAARGLNSGGLHLVVEQSDLARLPPLTWVSVQSEDGPAVLPLSPQDQALIRAELFAAPLSERLLQRINQAENIFLRDLSIDAKGVSAHARLEALLAAGPPAG